jgi:uncharacterized membrane protein YuzA (DUF378 family)
MSKVSLASTHALSTAGGTKFLDNTILVIMCTRLQEGTSMKFLRGLLSVLVTIGAVNWGLVGTGKFDLVARLFGRMSTASRIIYSLVGLAGLYHISRVKNEVAT